MAKPVKIGEYDVTPVDFDALELGEVSEMQRISGYKAGEFGQAFADGDVDLIVAALYIALKRSGHDVSLDDVRRLPAKTLVEAGAVLGDGEEPDADAAPDPTTTPEDSGSRSSAKSSGGTRAPSKRLRAAS